MPHLHYGEKIYPIKPERWEEFVKGVKEAFAKRLSEAQGISFDQIKEIAIALEPPVRLVAGGADHALCPATNNRSV